VRLINNVPMRTVSEEWDQIEKRLDCAWVLAPVAQRLGALMQSAARYPNIKPGQEFTGYQ
jgi:hypothetical protein